MATLDRKLPTTDALLYKPWSTFIDAAKLRCFDNVDLEETGKDCRKGREVVRLNREDMFIFGHSPFHDEFYLVVCNICNQVLKPQVFQSHCERRHGSTCKPSSSPALAPCNSRTSVVQMKPKTCISHNTFSSNSKPLKTPKDNLHTSINKQQHTGFPSRDTPCVPVPVVSLEKIPNLKADGANIKMNSTTTATSTNPASSSTTCSSALVKPALTSTALKPVPPSPEKILNGKRIIPPSLLDKKHQNGTKSSYKPNKRLSEREFDPNKYCGVLNPETKKPCTSSLACKGRKKRFDILLAEHKARTREKEAKKDIEPQGGRETSQSAQPQEHVAGSVGNTGPKNKVTSSAKSRPSNSYLSRPSSVKSVNGLSSSVCGGLVHEHIVSAVGGDVGSRLSSDDGETDGAEEPDRIDCHYSGHHPRPRGFCTFGTRVMGRGYYVFDRRWDQFYFALNSMVEKHLNSQKWKKIPPAADSPMPAHTTASFPVLQSFSSASAVYLSSSAVCSSIMPSYFMNSPVLSQADFVNTSDRKSVMSYTTALTQRGAAFSIVDPPFKAPLPMLPVPAVVQAPSRYKQSSKSLKISYSSGNKKKSANSSTPSPLLTSSVLSFAGSHKRNCVFALNSYQISSCCNNVSVRNSHNGTNPLRAKSEPSGRTSLSGSSADSIKHMSKH
ncbi:AT7L1 protein, partial [Polyodon spathula]|nr:AT7L1 protein [Polyodon spathula]